MFQYVWQYKTLTISEVVERNLMEIYYIDMYAPDKSRVVYSLHWYDKYPDMIWYIMLCQDEKNDEHIKFHSVLFQNGQL